MTIGFIGLGIMGSRMAANLLSAYPKVLVYNRDRAKMSGLLAKGATGMDSIKELVRKADIVITMLSTPEVVESIATGKDGILENAGVNTLWIDCTTVNPSFSKKMAHQALEHKVRFLDAPVAGSKIPAETAQLIFLVGGDKNDVTEAEPLLALMGRKTIHVGDHGQGSALKMVINLLLGQSLAVFSEAVAFGKKMGLAEDFLLTTLLHGPVVAPFVGLKEKNFTSDSYAAEFPLEWMHKDLRLAVLTAHEVGANLESGRVAEAYFNKALQLGLARNDCSAIFSTFQKKD